MTVQEIKAKLKTALETARRICEVAEGAKRDFSAEERTKVEGYLKEAADWKKKLAEAEGDEAMRKQIADLGFGLGDEKPGTPQGGPAATKGTWGEQFVNAPAFKGWMGQVAPTGQLSESVRGIVSPPVEFRGLPGRKDLITGANPLSAGAFVQTDYTGLYEPLGRIPLVLRDIVANDTTGSDIVEYVRQTVQVQEAAPTPEANIKEYTGASGEIEGKKPQGKMYWEKVHESVKTIAVWVAATRRALSDAGQLRGIIDGELRDDCDEELENQILNGDGVGENFTGIANTPGILTQAFDTDIIRTTRRAITTIRTTGRARPTAWVFNPADWETIELLQDLTGHYYWGGPMVQGQSQLWGIPVVECQSKAAGTAYLGDWRKAKLWDRQRTTIQVSDSHSDFFIRNIIAILAEMRAAFGLIRPQAFVEVALA